MNQIREQEDLGTGIAEPMSGNRVKRLPWPLHSTSGIRCPAHTHKPYMVTRHAEVVATVLQMAVSEGTALTKGAP